MSLRWLWLLYVSWIIYYLYFLASGYCSLFRMPRFRIVMGQYCHCRYQYSSDICVLRILAISTSHSLLQRSFAIYFCLGEQVVSRRSWVRILVPPNVLSNDGIICKQCRAEIFRNFFSLAGEGILRCQNVWQGHRKFSVCPFRSLAHLQMYKRQWCSFSCLLF